METGLASRGSCQPSTASAAVFCIPCPALIMEAEKLVVQPHLAVGLKSLAARGTYGYAFVAAWPLGEAFSNPSKQSPDCLRSRCVGVDSAVARHVRVCVFFLSPNDFRAKKYFTSSDPHRDIIY